MPIPENRTKRRERQAAEVEESQKGLRASIVETQRLVDEPDKMLGRHRQEDEEGDAAGDGS